MEIHTKHSYLLPVPHKGSGRTLIRVQDSGFWWGNPSGDQVTIAYSILERNHHHPSARLCSGFVEASLPAQQRWQLSALTRSNPGGGQAITAQHRMPSSLAVWHRTHPYSQLHALMLSSWPHWHSGRRSLLPGSSSSFGAMMTLTSASLMYGRTRATGQHTYR